MAPPGICMHRQKATWGCTMKVAKFKTGRETLRDTNPAGTWHLGLGLPGSTAMRKYISVVKPPRPWYFVMATLPD